VESNTRLKQAPGIEINEIADGFVIYDPKRDRVHYLNQTAGVILELCNGRVTSDELPALLQTAYELPAPPVEEVTTCVQTLLKEGLVLE